MFFSLGALIVLVGLPARIVLGGLFIGLAKFLKKIV